MKEEDNTRYKIYIRTVATLTDLSKPIKHSELTQVFDPQGYATKREAEAVIEANRTDEPINYQIIAYMHFDA